MPSPGERVAEQSEVGCGMPGKNLCIVGSGSDVVLIFSARHPSSVIEFGSKEPNFMPPSPRGKAKGMVRETKIYLTNLSFTIPQFLPFVKIGLRKMRKTAMMEQRM